MGLYQEAFEKFDKLLDDEEQMKEMLEEDTFSLTDDGLQEYKELMDNSEDVVDNTIDVYDFSADEEEDLQDSYVGKVILECNVCHTLSYEDEDNIKIDEESHDANVDEECGYCGSTEGFKVVGKVEKYGDSDEEDDEDDDSDEESPDDRNEDDEETEEDGQNEEHNDEQNEESSDNEFNESYDGRKSVKRKNTSKNKVNEFTIKRKKSLNEFVVESMKKGNHRKKLTEAPAYELTPEYDGRKSFYSKARVDVDDSTGVKTLYSYNTPVVRIDGDKVTLLDLWDSSATTLRHVKEFLQQNGFVATSKQQIKNTYLSESVTINTSNVVINDDASTGDIDINYSEDSVDNIDDVEKDDSNIEDNLDIEDDDEVIAPVSEEEISEIEDSSFDEMAESYLNKVYSNVKSYKTKNAYVNNDNKIYLEGIITFNNNHRKKTTFVFEAHKKLSNGKLKFIGENLQFANKKNSFNLTCSLNNKKLMCERLNYNYSIREKGKKHQIRGTMRVGD